MRERWKAVRKDNEIDLKPYAYKESERMQFIAFRHGVPIEEWANEFMYVVG